jgi:formylmethanofuran--tetrahydromethanopterin N-formyltransferase
LEIQGKGELFPLWMGRILITAISPEWALTAARAATGFGYKKGMEGGIDVRTSETPDGRPGVIVMIASSKKPALEREMARRITQSILPNPTASCYNAMDLDPEVEIVKLGDSIALFADGLQKKGTLGGRKGWILPSFDSPNGLFIESEFGIKHGVSTNLILIGDQASTLKAGMMFAESIQQVPSVSCPFPGGLSKFGLKLDSKSYDFMKDKGTIRQEFCPNAPDSKLGPNELAYQIIIDSVDVSTLFEAIRLGIEGIREVPGLSKITTSSYGGKLGEEFELSGLF